MKKKILVLAALSLAACSKADKDNAGQKVDELKLRDQWTGPCQNSALDLFHLAAKKETYVFGDETRRITMYYDKNDCTSEALKIEEKGSYSNFNKVNDQFSDIDFHWKNVQVTPLMDATRDLLKTLKFCSQDEWVTGTASDITGKTSDQPVIDRCWTKTPRDQFDIISKSDTEVRLGKASTTADKTTTSARPTELDNDVVFKK